MARSLKLIKKIGDKEKSVDINSSKREEITQILDAAMVNMESKEERF